MKPIALSTMAILIAGLSQPALAKAGVKVKWQNPDKYTDVRAANESRIRYRERVFHQLDEYWQKLADKLPDGQTLNVTVTNLDLAGQVWPGTFIGLDTTSDVRLIKRIDIPRIKFSYTLTDANGKVLKQADEDIKDMAFQDRTNTFFHDDPLRYEKNMIRDWFEDTFKEYLPAR